MADFLVMPVSHAFIMEEPEVVDQVIHFLQQGRFSRTMEITPQRDEK